MKAKVKDPSFNKDESTTTDKGMVENDHPEKSNSDSSDDLEADEQAAFKKIMGEIEGQEEEKLNGTANDSGAGEKDEQALTGDEQATLNGAIEAIDKGDPAEAKSDDSVDGLDEDQQKALESIMAQIEGGEAADEETGSGKETRDAESTESDDPLDGDQQKAFENIMAQIEGSETETAASDSVKEASSDPKPEEKSEDQEVKVDGPSNDETDLDTQDNSDDIDDILNEITSSDDESPLPETAADDSVLEPANVDAIEKTIVDDDIVAYKKEDRAPEQEDSPQTSPPAGKNGLPTESEERPSANDPSGHQLAEIAPAPANLQTPQKAQPLREATKSTGGGKKKAILASSVAILFLALAGYFYWIQKGNVDSKAPSPVTDIGRPDVAVETQPAPQPQEPVAVVHGSSDHSRLKTAAENLDRLRNELIEKQAEIEELCAYYQAGIDAEIQGILDMTRKAGKDTIPFKAAMADPRISLGLSAIQRRDTYIKKLVTPANVLFRNSEELLYFSRKAGLLTLMAGKTRDIDIHGFIKQADDVRGAHGSTLAKLNIDAVPESPLALESIWKDIEKRLSTTPAKPLKKPSATGTDNAAIWKNICDGDFTRKHKLTALSPEAARCLAAWKGKDLFLNALTDLSAEAAGQLAAWEGDWLGLNGLAELSPEAAAHLSRWKGKGLSLNGLSRLSPRVVAILSEWQGDQIELVNVKHMAHWENVKTRLFLSEDLKRKGNKP